MKTVLALLISDMHISTCPPSRCREPDWFAAMDRMLSQVRSLQQEYQCTVLCAGDVFDRWNASPELINWAMDHLPQDIIAIPGQHDLPNHSHDLIDRSAFQTLVNSDHICYDGDSPNIVAGDIEVHLFPWGREVVPCPTVNDGRVHVALIHSYLWIRNHHYAGAPNDQNILNWKHQLRGYHAAVFGDNHDGFLTKLGKTNVFNCGCLIRRKADERDYLPTVGLLLSDGAIERVKLDCSEDLWTEAPIKQEGEVVVQGLDQFINELMKLTSDSLKFRQSLERYIEGMDQLEDADVKQILKETMEGLR